MELNKHGFLRTINIYIIVTVKFKMKLICNYYLKQLQRFIV